MENLKTQSMNLIFFILLLMTEITNDTGVGGSGGKGPHPKIINEIILK